MVSRQKPIGDEIDYLFQLPLSHFIAARKALSTRLKKDGRADEAKRVNDLAKPSISVWAVNQLYWQHRVQFDQLIAAGQRFRRAHTSRTGKPGELNEALETRREAINRLSDLASELLREAGHNPALDTMRRIASTLEAISAYAVLPDDQAAGRLTMDLDPPGFESLAPFIRAVAATRSVALAPTAGARAQVASAKKKTVSRSDAGKEHSDQTRQAKLIAAKASLQDAKKILVAARTKAQTSAAAQKKADAELKNAEQHKREAEQRFKQASVAATEASVRAQNLAREVARAAKTLEDAERAAEKAARDLESLS